jgi:hypothetical protein
MLAAINAVINLACIPGYCRTTLACISHHREMTMKHKMFLIASFPLAAAILIGLTLDVTAGGTCPPMHIPSPTGNSETISFSYGSKSFPVDVYSAFAPQVTTKAPPNFCLQYAATNRASDSIEKFYWPLAGIQMDTLSPRQGVSLIVTQPPGREPTIEETWIYAFLNSTAKTSAFQRKAEGSLLSVPLQLAFATDSGRKRSSMLNSDLSALTIAFRTDEQRFTFKEPTSLADVSSQFSIGGAEEVSSSSEGSWDGKASKIQIRLERGSETTAVFAPVVYALIKAGSASDFLNLIRQFTDKPDPIYFDKKSNSFEFVRTLDPVRFNGAQALYVIEQPVTIITPTSKACFSSPIYSPIPVPAELLQCRLF